MVIVLLFSSCSTNFYVEKRIYNKGFYYAINQKQKKVKQNDKKSITLNTLHPSKQQIPLTDSINKISFADNFTILKKETKQESENLIASSNPKKIIAVYTNSLMKRFDNRKISNLLKSRINQIPNTNINHETPKKASLLASLIVAICFLILGVVLVFIAPPIYAVLFLLCGLALLIATIVRMIIKAKKDRT